jgi:signal transduction histidine kinase
LNQLVDNAIKFTPAPGEVTLGARQDGSFVTIFVQDTGIGIHEERQEEILIPFHQLDGSPTRSYGGTGLGLALVKLILDAHGSPLEIESQEGVGSTFRFSLPTVEDQQ